jgi:hypothetical protein
LRDGDEKLIDQVLMLIDAHAREASVLDCVA